MTTLQKHMPDAYKRIARMVGYCLVSPDEASMCMLSAILYARLQPGERKFLAVALLMSLSDEECHAVHGFLEGNS